MIQVQFEIPVVYFGERKLDHEIESIIETTAPFGFILAPFNTTTVGVAIGTAMRRSKAGRSIRDRLISNENYSTPPQQTNNPIPICLTCKKVKDTSETWRMIEGFLQTITDISFSHGYCPNCAEEEMNRTEKLIASLKGPVDVKSDRLCTM